MVPFLVYELTILPVDGLLPLRHSMIDLKGLYFLATGNKRSEVKIILAATSSFVLIVLAIFVYCHRQKSKFSPIVITLEATQLTLTISI